MSYTANKMISLSERGKRIKLLRTKAEYSLADLANRTSSSKATLSLVENGQVELTGEKIVSLAKTLKTTTDYILIGKTAINREIDAIIAKNPAIFIDLSNLLTKNHTLKLVSRLAKVSENDIRTVETILKRFEGTKEG